MKNYNSTLRALARYYGEKFHDLTSLTTDKHFSLYLKIEEFNHEVTTLLKKQLLLTAVARYDLEYATAEEVNQMIPEAKACFSRTHYCHYSPVFEPAVLMKLLSEVNLARAKFADIGCGNGTLLFALQKNGVPRENLFGVDISGKGVDRTLEQGFAAVQGTARDLIPETDVMFHSYFIDRDENQKATFNAIEQKLSPKGRLIIEGLFPCIMNDSNGISYGRANITEGRNASEDIRRVVEYLQKADLHLRSVMMGKRLVYSLDGAEVLPTFILSFDKCA